MQKLFDRYFDIVAMVIIVLIFAGAIAGSVSFFLDYNYQENNVQYEIFYIEEMPCISIHDGAKNGYSCDWDKWTE